MNHFLEIPDILYTALKEAADTNGLNPVEWIAAQLPRTRTAKGPEAGQVNGPKTLAQLFVGRVGRIRSGGKEHLSEECGTKFTDYLEEKRKAGHL